MSNRAVLEVIALDAEDAVAAQAGGADRLELVTDMAADGLTPSRETFAAIRSAVDIPLRVMLRVADGFAAGDIDVLVGRAHEMREAGADEFVFGFLDADGRADLVAVERLVAELDGCRWTFHRAIDRAADRDALRKQLADLPGLDTFLTAGSPAGWTRASRRWWPRPPTAASRGTRRRSWSAAASTCTTCPNCGWRASTRSTSAARPGRPAGRARWTRRPYGSGARHSTPEAIRERPKASGAAPEGVRGGAEPVRERPGGTESVRGGPKSPAPTARPGPQPTEPHAPPRRPAQAPEHLAHGAPRPAPTRRSYPSASGSGAACSTVSPDTARVSATYSRRSPVRSSGSPSTTAAGSSSTT